MPGDSQRASILIVDDSPANIKVLGHALRGDYRVRFATNGADGLRMVVAEQVPDLILLDILMPEMDGYQLCTQLKTDPATQHIPVIFITGNDEVADETRGLELGAVDYITKPFSMAVVKARIRTHLELKRHRDGLERLSALDGLTGIANRRRFEQLLELEWRRAVAARECVSVVMIDIDHFKIFNDTYGHLAGDDCIRRVAAELATCLERHHGTIARYGGEEFAAVLPRVDGRAARLLAEELRARIASLQIPHAGPPRWEVVTISAGTGTALAQAAGSPTEVVAQADQALYAAKRGGRNRVEAASDPAAG